MATAKSTMPAPLPLPPPVPSRSAIAPQPMPEQKGPNPEREFAKRQSEAIAARTGARAEAEGATEVAAPPPKAKDSKAGSPPESLKKSEPARADQSDSKDPAAKKPAVSSKPESKPSETEASESSDTPEQVAAKRGPRYELKAFAKWAEEHPEEAAEIGERVYKLPKDEREFFIRAKNRERKLRTGLQKERDAAVADAQALRDEAKTHRDAIDGAATKLAPMADLWEAVREKVEASKGDMSAIDFDAADAAFQETSGVTIDDYMRARARRGVGANPEAVRMRIENQKLKRQLEAKAPEKAAEPEKAKLEAEPATEKARDGGLLSDWGSEIPKTHKLRQISGWEGKLDAAMARYYDEDLDEYSVDPEEMAGRVLKKELALLAADDDDELDAPAPKKRKVAAADGAPKRATFEPPKAKPRAAPRDDDGDGLPQSTLAKKLTPKASNHKPFNEEEGPSRWQDRQQWAIQRAQERARNGEFE